MSRRLRVDVPAADGTGVYSVPATDEVVIFVSYVSPAIFHQRDPERDRRPWEDSTTLCGQRVFYTRHDAELDRVVVVVDRRGLWLPLRLLNLETARPCRRCFP